MSSTRLIYLAALMAVCLHEIQGHGKMIDPPNRSSLWRFKQYRRARINSEDNQNYCGGFTVQHQSNGGKCGPCGDNYKAKVPRQNENGGIYGRGKIVKKYRAGHKIKVVIDVSANHLGHFEFNICELKRKREPETEKCFDEHRLKVVDKNGKISDKYHVGSTRGRIPIEVYLPEGFKCKRCVLRWHYTAGNNWGICDRKTGKGKLGCGPQETFRSCSDIAIH